MEKGSRLARGGGSLEPEEESVMWDRAGRGVAMLVAWMSVGLPVAAQWPQWRGVARDGLVSGPARKGNWPAKLSLVWERETGEGYSGPVVEGDRVWIHTRQGEKEVVSSLRLSTGDMLWSQSYEAPFGQDNDARAHGRGPYSTPAVAGGRLFTYGILAVLSAWDAGTGRLSWRRESKKEFRPGFPYFGAAASPLVWGDLCFVHLGGQARSKLDPSWAGAIVALSVADGRERWRWSGDGPACGASPIVVEIEGRPQLVFKTLWNMVGFDPRTGRKLWQIPWKVSQANTIVTPVFADGRLITSDYDMGMSAWRIQPQGESWEVRQLWSSRDASLFMSSPVMAQGVLVGFSHFRKGQLFGLDPATGTVLWRGEPRSGDHATLIAWGGEVLAFLENGSLVVGEPSRGGFRQIRTYPVGSAAAWAHAAVADGRIVVKDGKRLAVYRVEGR